MRLAAKGLLERGRRVALVSDAIEAIDPAAGRQTLERLKTLGARMITTDEALAARESRPHSLRQKNRDLVARHFLPCRALPEGAHFCALRKSGAFSKSFLK